MQSGRCNSPRTDAHALRGRSAALLAGFALMIAAVGFAQEPPTPGAAPKSEGTPVPKVDPKSEGTPVPDPGKGPAVPPPELEEAEQVRIDPELPWFSFVEDDAPLRSADENEDEHMAYNYTVAHARRHSLEALARHSKKEVPFANMIKKIHVDYLRELIRVEGRLARLEPMKSTKFLAETEKVKQLYEGWLFPKDEQFPVCILFSELPEGLKPGIRLDNVWVKFDGYFFKLLHYETAEQLKGKNQWRRAPLLIGRSPVKMAPPADESFLSFSNALVPAVVVVIVIVVFSAVFLSVRYRRGDRVVRRQVEQSKYQNNPFQEVPPPVEPGAGWNRLG